jgi:uncharacterized protein
MATNNLARPLIYLTIIILSAALVYNFVSKSPAVQSTQQKNAPYAVVNNVRINLEIAASDAEKTKGLGYRPSLDQNTGMLFIYEQPAHYTFWMQGMQFALDFLWIDNNRVEDIHENILPPAQTNSTPQVVSPKVPVRYILEVNAGFIKKHNIKVGDSVELNF